MGERLENSMVSFSAAGEVVAITDCSPLTYCIVDTSPQAHVIIIWLAGEY